MAIFSTPDEKEIEKRKQELDRIAAEIERREADVANRESIHRQLAEELTSKREAETKALQSTREELSAWEQRLLELEQQVKQMEAKAKAGFVEEQREAFKGAIETRMRGLDERQSELESLEKRLADHLETLTKREGELVSRETTVLERELKADAGFADKLRVLQQEIEAREKACGQREQILTERDAALRDENAQTQSEKEELRKRAADLQRAEQERDAGYAEQRRKLEEEIHQNRLKAEAEQERLHAERLAAQDAQLQALRHSRLTEIEEQERQHASRLALHESELQTLRQKRLDEIEAQERLHSDRMTAQESELQTLRKKRLAEIEEQERIERERFAAELSERQVAHETAIRSANEQLQSERERLQKIKGQLDAQESDLTYRESLVEARGKKLAELEEEFEERVARAAEERRLSFQVETESLKRELERVRNSLEEQRTLMGYFEELKLRLGEEEPEQVLTNLKLKTAELLKLRQELANQPAAEIQQRIDLLQEEKIRLEARVEDLTREASSHRERLLAESEVRAKLAEAEAENKSLSNTAAMWKASEEQAQAELKRLRSAYERPAEIAARYKEIEMPHIKAEKVKQPRKPSKDDPEIDEVKWLKDVGDSCKDYGLHFNDRILKAFHTALKTSEWSPMTVLAGVSGTGKSELPRLYSHFGGLYFEPLSVQPNWDSQESMLGFFNSIDNKFDAQPVLRLLAQTQQRAGEPYDKRIARWRAMAGTDLKFDAEKDKDLIQALQESEYPGLEDSVCLILLDEMNLAHPELYFAEFLSKLELRRGKKGADVPFLPVKIGAGIPPYQLPLGRNVLWTGTMNQDETTKSLSDKVLDRSIIIHFPRPTSLKSRPKLKTLDETPFVPLHRKTWESWWVKEVNFSTEEIAPYRQFLENMNSSLADAGRAIGHRVWQSVEYYMANYPDVRAAQQAADKNALERALHVAFEDQLVQKVMPKLRGIDTPERSVGGKCLVEIRGQISNGVGGNPFKLIEDFDLACKLGHGQFIWQSANYLKEEGDSGDNVSLVDNLENANHPKEP